MVVWPAGYLAIFARKVLWQGSVKRSRNGDACELEGTPFHVNQQGAMIGHLGLNTTLARLPVGALRTRTCDDPGPCRGAYCLNRAWGCSFGSSFWSMLDAALKAHSYYPSCTLNRARTGSHPESSLQRM